MDTTEKLSDAKPEQIEGEALQTDQEQQLDDKPKEIGGPEGPEPTRYGDWEVAGRCSDF